MIERSAKFDLGLDTTRIKDPRDARRQEATVDALLDRLFNPDPRRRWEIQILADEVGMGKTFVALATAFSVLEAMQNDEAPEDLRGCYQKVLIVTPNNSALFNKWNSEVGEFIQRCVKEEHRTQAKCWFRSVQINRVDDLIIELRKKGNCAKVIVTNTGIFSGGKLLNYDLKRRQLLGVLFRYWGTRFRNDSREKLLKGAPMGWPDKPGSLSEFRQADLEKLSFYDEELLSIIRKLDKSGDRIESLLEKCQEIAAPFNRNRDLMFKAVENLLIEIYRWALTYMIKRSFPLVIVDEVHNWKNGPERGANGYNSFIELVGKRSRRALLMTATPFQLKPDEILQILRIGEELRPCSVESDANSRQERLKDHRHRVIEPILKDSSRYSRQFTKAWGKLSSPAIAEQIEQVWKNSRLTEARDKLKKIAHDHGHARPQDVEAIVNLTVEDIDPSFRQLIREALHLYVYNADLSHELGKVVIRHRRRTEHRLVRVGEEYRTDNNQVQHRPDRHLLHTAPGLDVRGNGELPHYLLMRCVSEMKGGKGKSSLGSTLTGCYSTLLESAEGKAVQQKLAQNEVGKLYLDMLNEIVDEKNDPHHPKVREVVEFAMHNWRAGEKTLIFCFRINTARRLRDIIKGRIRQEMNIRREECLGGQESLKSLRARLTGRDRDLIVIGLDRIFWSVIWSDTLARQAEIPPKPEDLELTDDELLRLAEMAWQFDVDLTEERIDRIFLHRATEHIIANRMRRQIDPKNELKLILDEVGAETWVSYPYGLKPESNDETEAEADRADNRTGADEEDGVGKDNAHVDERGVHQSYEKKNKIIDSQRIEKLAQELRDRRSRARRQGQISLFDVYQQGPSFWLGADPVARWKNDGESAETIRSIHNHLAGFLIEENGARWQSRKRIFQALRRAVLRESVLLRILPNRKDRDEAGWGELLVKSFFDSLPEQRESMADRIKVFLEDLLAASGSFNQPSTPRHSIINATELKDQHFVALVTGDIESDVRERIFQGFNTPLMPEVLICTSVGQEGIDLHRHCRHVVHYDLAWNPAVLEQRTGRADRIGSKTFRERSFADLSNEAFLEIGVPYLAGTYDERMYEELRLRAQIFEVLTGGDLVVDQAEGLDDQKNAEGQAPAKQYIPLPPSMLEDLRVRLHVWE